MVRNFSEERRDVAVSTNEVPGDTYIFHVRDPMVSSPWFPYLTVEARRLGDSRTKVTITRGGATHGRRRELEQHWLETVTHKLEDVR